MDFKGSRFSCNENGGVPGRSLDVGQFTEQKIREQMCTGLEIVIYTKLKFNRFPFPLIALFDWVDLFNAVSEAESDASFECVNRDITAGSAAWCSDLLRRSSQVIDGLAAV